MSLTDRRTRRTQRALDRQALTRKRDDNLLVPDVDLLTALEVAAPGGVAARASDRLSFAHDASHYLLVPQAVVTPTDARGGGQQLQRDGLRHRAEHLPDRTCELGMTRATGHPYQHLLEILDDVTRPRQEKT